MATLQPTIRLIESGDVDVLYKMICALGDNQNEREFVTTTPALLEKTGFSVPPMWAGLIVEIEGRAVGYATYTNDFHIWSGAPRITIDDIFVHPEYRSLGLGEKLMRRIFDVAEETDAFVSWTVQPENTKAIDFYKRLGAKYRVTGKCGWRAAD
jgi:ribosomal protein S18 acetylase RimI-like enzyme